MIHCVAAVLRSWPFTTCPLTLVVRSAECFTGDKEESTLIYLITFLKVIEDCSHALELYLAREGDVWKRQSGGALVCRALAYEQLERHQDALQDFRRAVESYPSNCMVCVHQTFENPF